MPKEVDIVFEIEPDGTTRIEVQGAVGAGCKGLTANYEKLFGDVKTERLKDEYHDVRVDSRQRASG